MTREASSLLPPASDGRARVVLGCSALILAAAGTIAAATSHAEEWHPVGLVVILAAFAALSQAMAMRSVGSEVEAAPWTITSIAPLVLAIGLLGPAPAMAIAVVGFLAAYTIARSQMNWLIGNPANFGVVAVAGGLLLQCLIHRCGLAPNEPGFSLLFLGAYCLASCASLLLLGLQGALVGRNSAWAHFWEKKPLAAGATTALFATGAAYFYKSWGINALGLMIVVQLAFQYLASRLVISRERARAFEQQARQRSELSATRGRLVAQVLEAEEAERRRLAEALHGDALQNLISAQHGLASTTHGAVDQARSAIGRAIDQLRDEIFDLHPTVLKHMGLEAALVDLAAHQAERGGFRAKVNVEAGACGVHDQVLFALGREQLTNAAKHSNASEVALTVSRRMGKIVMEVTDNGRGMDSNRPDTALRQGHIGLASCSERIDALGGTFAIDSEPGRGTRLYTTLPGRRRETDYRSIPRRIASATAAARFDTPSFS